MEEHIAATQAARSFSELLNRVKFKGEKFIVERGGKPIAQIKPIRTAEEVQPLKVLMLLLEKLPKLGDELESFAADLDILTANQPPLPEDGQWE